MENTIITVQVTIDTDLITRSYSKSGNKPVRSILVHPDCGYMVAEGTTGGMRRGNCKLAFDACTGDVIRVFGTSGSGNFDDAVLIQGITHVAGTDVVEDFKSISIVRNAIVPCDGPDVLPGIELEQRSWCHVGTIVGLGTGKYRLAFSLHTRDENGLLQLLGHYHFTPAIKITGYHRTVETSTTITNKTRE